MLYGIQPEAPAVRALVGAQSAFRHGPGASQICRDLNVTGFKMVTFLAVHCLWRA